MRGFSLPGEKSVNVPMMGRIMVPNGIYAPTLGSVTMLL